MQISRTSTLYERALKFCCRLPCLFPFCRRYISRFPFSDDTFRDFCFASDFHCRLLSGFPLFRQNFCDYRFADDIFRDFRFADDIFRDFRTPNYFSRSLKCAKPKRESANSERIPFMTLSPLSEIIIPLYALPSIRKRDMIYIFFI